MGSKTFRSLRDFLRHGVDIHLTCENPHCDHFGIADAHEVTAWFRIHRWPDALEGNALSHFRCTQCGAKAGRAQPTMNAVTVNDFFPADDRGWKRLMRRLRG